MSTSIFSHVLAPAPRLLMRLALVPELLDAMTISPRRILEIGPGLGDLSMYLASRFPAAQGVLMDISGPATEGLRHRIETRPNLSVQTGDFRNLSDDMSFDLVVACEVFEHIEDEVSAFEAVGRFLPSGAHFIFSAPAFMSKWGPADEYAGHFRRYERRDIECRFAQHGFEIIKLLCYGFPLTHLLAPIHKYYYKKLIEREPVSMDDATKRSGTERSLVQRFAKLPVSTLMTPFFLSQQLAKCSNIGDGYLVLARKI
jgi:SAM-dependent methyltransferase